MGHAPAMDAGELPSWVQAGATCRWWSQSQNTYHQVVVTSIDVIRRRVVVHFSANNTVWKSVAFSQIGVNGPLRPLDAGNAKPTTPEARKAERTDGTATPPWYDQLNVAETRQEVLQVIKQKEETQVATQERRRFLWQQELQRRADEERRHREEERRAREAAAERERLRILEKLKKEREEEQLRQFEVLLLSKEDEVSRKANAIWRQREEVARRQRYEEEQQQFDEEQRMLTQRLIEERASRPRIAFGVKTREPAKATIPQPVKAAAPEQDRPDWDSWGSDAWQEPESMTQPSPQSRLAPHHLPINANMNYPKSAPAWNPPGQTPSPPARPTAATTVAAKEWYALQIRTIYQKHNPDKLADVPHLMQKYAGCEEEMYDRICEKYGVRPAAPPENLRPFRQLPAPAPPKEEPKEAVGFARKAGAPAPKDTHAPSTSDLMARYKNLVKDLPKVAEEDSAVSAQEVNASTSFRRPLARSLKDNADRGTRRGDGYDSSQSYGAVGAPIGARKQPVPSASSAVDRGRAVANASWGDDRSWRDSPRAESERRDDWSADRRPDADPLPIGMHAPRNNSREREIIPSSRQRALPIGAPLRGSAGQRYRATQDDSLRHDLPQRRSRSRSLARRSGAGSQPIPSAARHRSYRQTQQWP
ncbi:unnamed protein product [Effrenium voratum]|uniref:CTF/NF-I domain-containing protein n=1 Tax=Effrenium voratum TaxID=2562239 RepID=A0AA36JM18_9DINO|nr:unnamed protein product [Effrenium voratum]CAJ1455153.1 unnamed protein product [Effrenium voratum]